MIHARKERCGFEEALPESCRRRGDLPSGLGTGSEHWCCLSEPWAGQCRPWAGLPSQGTQRLSTACCAFGTGTAQGGSSKSCTRLTPNLKGPGVFQAEWGGRGHGAWGDAIRFVSQKAHSGCRVENEFLNLTTNLLCEELTAW